MLQQCEVPVNWMVNDVKIKLVLKSLTITDQQNKTLLPFKFVELSKLMFYELHQIQKFIADSVLLKNGLLSVDPEKLNASSLKKEQSIKLFKESTELIAPWEFSKFDRMTGIKQIFLIHFPEILLVNVATSTYINLQLTGAELYKCFEKEFKDLEQVIKYQNLVNICSNVGLNYVKIKADDLKLESTLNSEELLDISSGDEKVISQSMVTTVKKEELNRLQKILSNYHEYLVLQHQSQSTIYDIYIGFNTELQSYC